MINNHKVRLTIDTGGGPGIVLDKAAAKGMTLDHSFLASLHGVQGYEPVTEGIAHSMTFGPLILRAIDTIVRQDAAPNDFCTLGIQAFEHYRVTLDFTAKTMTLSRGGVPAVALKGEKSCSIPFYNDGGSILAPVHVLKLATWAQLDSGCDLNVLTLSVAKTAAAQLPPGETVCRIFNQRIGTGTTHTSFTMMFLAKPVPISLDADATVTIFGTTSQIGTSDLEDEINPDIDVPTGVRLGVPFLLQFRRVIIDYPNHMLILQGPEHGAPINMARSSPQPGKPWPGYQWQRVGDGWVEAPDKTALEKAAQISSPPANTPIPTSVTQTKTTGTTNFVSQPDSHGSITVTINGKTIVCPAGTVTTIDKSGNVVTVPMGAVNSSGQAGSLSK